MYIHLSLYIYIYIYIYIYMYIVGRHHLSNANCLIRPRLFYACSVVSRIAILATLIATFEEQPALDK